MAENDRVEALRQRIEKTTARRDALTARLMRMRSAESSHERKARTRRLILLGTRIEHLHEKAPNDPVTPRQVFEDMDRWLDRPRDRAVFGLPPRPSPPA